MFDSKLYKINYLKKKNKEMEKRILSLLREIKFNNQEIIRLENLKES